MPNSNIGDEMVEYLDHYFGCPAKDYVIRESTATPYIQLIMEFTVYNYFVVRLTVEKNTMFFSIFQSGNELPLLKSALSIESLDSTIKNLDEEIRLRIPDKYLQAKGW